jgi:hypothetical protein
MISMPFLEHPNYVAECRCIEEAPARQPPNHTVRSAPCGRQIDNRCDLVSSCIWLTDHVRTVLLSTYVRFLSHAVDCDSRYVTFHQ